VKTIGVFGANGMLGKYVVSYLRLKNYEVYPFSRENCDLSNYDEYFKINELIQTCTHIVNCAGTIKPVSEKQSSALTFMVNTIFPNYLARECENKDIAMYHITTDCIYSGDKGHYNESDKCDAYDDYGLSKWMGENQNICNIRTSIIGEETKNKRSLLEWAKSQKGNEINGYTNHYWNGVTCLQFAKILDYLIQYNIYWSGDARHIFSESVSKFELLNIISHYFNLSLKISPVEASIYCDRTLDTAYYGLEDYPVISIKEQIKELAEFHDTLFRN